MATGNRKTTDTYRLRIIIFIDNKNIFRVAQALLLHKP